MVDDFLILTVIRMNLKDYCHRSLPRRQEQLKLPEPWMNTDVILDGEKKRDKERSHNYARSSFAQEEVLNLLLKPSGGVP